MGEGGYWNRAGRRSGGYRPRVIGGLPIASRDEEATHSAWCAVLNPHHLCDFPKCQCECHRTEGKR
jgi:hypothetical protein